MQDRVLGASSSSVVEDEGTQKHRSPKRSVWGESCSNRIWVLASEEEDPWAKVWRVENPGSAVE